MSKPKPLFELTPELRCDRENGIIAIQAYKYRISIDRAKELRVLAEEIVKELDNTILDPELVCVITTVAQSWLGKESEHPINIAKEYIRSFGKGKTLDDLLPNIEETVRKINAAVSGRRIRWERFFLTYMIQCMAMNCLTKRGYWEEKTTKEVKTG